MEKSVAETVFECPVCKSNDIAIVVGENEGGALFAEETFDDRDPAICGDCHHKDQAADFIKSTA